MLTKDDKLLWKSKNQEELTQDFCGTQTPLADRTHAMAVNGLY
jgi:hypothetical protein